MRFSWLIAILFGASICSYSQISTYYTQENFNFNLAENHYLHSAYLGAAYDFNQLYHFNKDLSNKQKQLAELYGTNVALLYEDTNAIEAFKHFLEKYPNDPIDKQLYYGAGMYYFNKNDPEKAKEYLRKADVSSFSTNQKNQYNFTLGYIYFEDYDFSKAKGYINKVEDVEPYKEPRAYMLGHIAYIDEDYTKALEYFDQLIDNPDYQRLLAPYLVQIYYNQGKYEQCAFEGKKMIDSGAYGDLTVDLAKIVGESEFQLQNYGEALPYLRAYVDTAEKVTLPDYYQLGYVYYIQGDYEEAVKYFNKITNEQSAIAQNAFYQLGNSYLKNNQKEEAVSAYKSASEMDYNPQLQEEAAYNYALVSYDIGNPYEAASEAILKFLKDYPNSSHKSEMESLLVSSFFLTKNYKGALETINQIPNKSQKLLDTQQKLALLNGIELYNSNKIGESIIYFNQALDVKNGSKYYAKALYWKGSALYLQGNYEKSLQCFLDVSIIPVSFSEQQQLPYEMGYCYLKLEDFNNAAIQFQKYLQNPKLQFVSDAQLRLADSYYGSQNVDAAITTYNAIESSGGIDSDFATLQKAKLYGYKGDSKSQIAVLENFSRQYPDSPYLDEANYELGVAYQNIQSYLSSIVAFDKVIKSAKDTQLTALAMIGKANDLAAIGETSSALELYKQTASLFKNTDYAKQAVLASKPIYIENGDISGYQQFAAQNNVGISSDEAQELNFLQAQQLYLTRDYEGAVPLLQEFIKLYPNGTKTLAAQYYLGNSYYMLKNDEMAIKYLTPIAKNQNEYQDDALYDLGRIYTDEQNDEQAFYAYEALYKFTQNENYRSMAEVELMYLYDDKGDFENATKMAKLVLTNSKHSEATLEQANVILARSNLTSNPKLAKEQFKALEKAKNPSVKAEAYYYDAYFKNQDKKYEASNEVIFDLTSNISDEQYWGAKALVVMADNYYNLKDDYQASYILDEVIKNYSDYPDVVKEAQTLQSKIKK